MLIFFKFIPMCLYCFCTHCLTIKLNICYFENGLFLEHSRPQRLSCLPTSTPTVCTGRRTYVTSLPKFIAWIDFPKNLTDGAPLARFTRLSSSITRPSRANRSALQIGKLNILSKSRYNVDLILVMYYISAGQTSLLQVQ